MKCFKSCLFSLASLCLMSPDSLAIPEEDFAVQYQELVIPFFNNHAEVHYYNPPHGGHLHYRTILQDRPSPLILILPGRSEPLIKYDELSYDLFHRGYSIVLLDLRGQGGSIRVLDDPHKGHIDHFDTYLMDLESFLKEVVEELPKTSLLSIAHSMGANILSLFVAKHPTSFQRVVLSSPMVEINSELAPAWLTQGITWLYNKIGLEDNYIWGGGPPKIGDADHHKKLSQSAARNAKRIAMEQRHPEYVVGSATFGWLQASFQMTELLKSQAHLIDIPVMILLASEDQVVKVQSQTELCMEIPKCRLVVLHGAYHEILHEADRFRDRALESIESFFSAPELSQNN